MDSDDMFGDDDDYYGGGGGNYPNYANYDEDDKYDNYGGYVEDSPTQRLFGETHLYNDYGFQPPLEEYTDMFIPKPFFDFESNKRSEKIKKFTTSEEIFMIITDSNRVFRWEVGGQNVQELLIPGTGDRSGAAARDLFGAVKSGLTVDQKGLAVVERCFLDQKGTHCLLCTTKGENYYINKRSDKVKLLRNFRERIRSAVIDEQSSEQLVKIACGTYEGKIYHFDIEVGKNEVNDLLPTLVTGNLKSPILHMEYFNYVQQEGMRENIQRAVFVLTSQYLYYFKGQRDFKTLFRDYIGVDPNKYPGLPIALSSRRHPLINFYIKKGFGNSIIVSDGNSMHYCKLPEKTLTTEFYPFAKMQTLKYAKKELSADEKDHLTITDPPIAIACSQYHYFILHKDSLTILSTINESVVAYYEGKDLCDTGEVKGMIVERGGDNIYVYDSNSIRTISFGREGQDVWELYLEKNKYQEAYDICKRNRLPSLKYVAGLYGDSLFKQEKFEQAIDKYVESSKSFEEICLKYINRECMQYLEKYLQNTLNRDFVKRSKMRKAILSSWVLENRLHYVNEKDREIELSTTFDRTAKENEKSKTSKPLRDFLTIGEKYLHVDVTYSLLQSHGRFREFVNYAEMKEKYEDIILHHINEGQFDQAIVGLERLREKGEIMAKFEDTKLPDEEAANKPKKSMVKSEKVPFDLIRDIIYSHGHVLMYENSGRTLGFLDKRDSRTKERIIEWDLTKLMPGFMKVPFSQRDKVIAFLEDDCVTTTRCKDRAVHNLYIMFLSDLDDEQKLAEYLRRQEELLLTQEMREGQEAREILFDTEFALKCFQRNHLIRPQLTLYSVMGLYSNAVDLALNNNMIDEAKEIAAKPQGETFEIIDLKKKLWLQIAFHLIHNQDTEECMRLTQESDGALQIEDLLPHFDDGFRIELFKDEISDSLKSYVETIKKQKNDLSVYEKTAEDMKNELRHLRNRHFDLKGDEKCVDCQRSIFGEEFYLFPCRHCYHRDCLKKKVKNVGMISEDNLLEIESLEIQIANLQSAINSMQGTQNVGRSMMASTPAVARTNTVEIPGRTASISVSQVNGRSASVLDNSFIPAFGGSVADFEKSIKEKKKRVDFLLAGDCVNCGKYLIETIPISLAKNSRLRNEWSIK